MEVFLNVLSRIDFGDFCIEDEDGDRNFLEPDYDQPLPQPPSVARGYEEEQKNKLY